MPPTTARRRWTVVLAVQLAAALLAAGAHAGSAAEAGELVWLGETGGEAEERWTTDPSVRPWRDADGGPAAFQDGQPVVLDERAVNRAVVVADPDGVAPASVRFSHRTGRYTLDALGPGGVTGLTTLTVDGDGELEVRNANGYAGTTDLRRGLLSLGDDAALGHSTLVVGGGAVRALGDRRLANPVRFRHPDGQGPVTATITGDDDLTVDGDVELSPGHPTGVAVDGAGVARLLGAVRDPAGGAGLLVKLGDGVLELGGDGNRHRGGTVVAGGTLLAGAARGSATGSGPVTVRAAATLGGAGTLTGPVTVRHGGTVAPGAAPGQVATLATTGRLTLHRGAGLDVEVAPEAAAQAAAHQGPGPARDLAGGAADRLRVDGGVRLDQAELRVTVAAGAPTGGAPITVVDNTGNGRVAGTFRGLPEGATVSARTAHGLALRQAGSPAARFRIGYRGGDGNDVVLEPLWAALPAPRPVTLAAVADQAVDEGEPLALQLHADPGDPASPLRWRLLGAPPAGLRLDRHGALRWTPREAHGPGRYRVAVRVEDAGDPGRHDQRSFTVTVGEVNRPPALRGPARASVAEGRALRLAFAAGDPDRPGARLEYGLTGDAPAGARIDPRTGVLRWTPGDGQGPGRYTMVVWVLDAGTPRLADTGTVTVTVTPRPAAATAAEAKPSPPAAPPPPPAGRCHARHG
jgi:autotransporter-associated beta strand protein